MKGVIPMVIDFHVAGHKDNSNEDKYDFNNYVM